VCGREEKRTAVAWVAWLAQLMLTGTPNSGRDTCGAQPIDGKLEMELTQTPFVLLLKREMGYLWLGVQLGPSGSSAMLLGMSLRAFRTRLYFFSLLPSNANGRP
jgi:hypothetical protein